MPSDRDLIEGGYREVLQHARRRGYAIGAQGALALDTVFTQSINQIAARLGDLDGPAAEHAERLHRELRALFAQLEQKIGNVLETGVALEIEEVLGVHREFLAKLGPRLGIKGLEGALGGANTAALSIVLARGGTASSLRSLVKYSMGQALDDVDRFIERAVLTGVSAGQATRDLATMMGGADLAKHLPSASRLHRGALGRLDPRRYGVSEAEFPAVRRVLFDARRIAVSEQNNALREASRQATSRAGLVEAVAWQRSGLHDAIPSTPDECDVLAEANTYGHGPGMYPPHKFPDAPHPVCACCQGRVKPRRPSEWLTPLPDQPVSSSAGASIEAAAKRLGRQGGLSDTAIRRMSNVSRRSIISGGSVPLQVPGRIQAATGAFKLSAQAMARRPAVPVRPKAPIKAERPTWDRASNSEIPTERDVFKADNASHMRGYFSDVLDKKVGAPQSGDELSMQLASALNVQVSNGPAFSIAPGVQQVVIQGIKRDATAEQVGALAFYRTGLATAEIGMSANTAEGMETFARFLRMAQNRAELEELLEANFKANPEKSAIKAFHAVTHELHHALSPGQAMGVKRSLGNSAIEEGLVETFARDAVRGATGATYRFSDAYDDWVDNIAIWRKRRGDEAIRELWNTPSGFARMGKVQTWVGETISETRQAALDLGLPELPYVNASLDDAGSYGAVVVSQMDEAIATLRAGGLGKASAPYLLSALWENLGADKTAMKSWRQAALAVLK